jgi:hypothetical protein
MKTRSVVFVVILFVASSVASAAPKSPMKPGKWQITMQMVVPGIPENMKGVGMLAPMTIDQCITKEQAENPQPPKMDKSKVDCDKPVQKFEGQTVTFMTKCRKPEMTMDGKLVFSGNTYKGETRVSNAGRTATYKYSGKYLGACDKKKDE